MSYEPVRSVFSLTPRAGVVAVSVVLLTAVLGIVLYRHVKRLHEQQTELERSVEQQQRKSKQYRRQFQQTQNQLHEVKREIDEYAKTATSGDENEQTAGESTDPRSDDTASETARETAPRSADDTGTVRETAPKRPDDTETVRETAPRRPDDTETVQETAPPSGSDTEPRASHTPTTASTAPTVAGTVEESWASVQTHAAVLKVVDSKRVTVERSRFTSALQDVFRVIVDHGAHSGDEGPERVLTSNDVKLRAEHANPRSDVAIENGGGVPSPRRRTANRLVVTVGTTATGFYIECASGRGSGAGSAARASTESRGFQRESNLAALRRQLGTHGWDAELERIGDGAVRIDVNGFDTSRAVST